MTYPLPVPTNRMNKADSAALEAAVAALEKTSFAKKLAHLAGRQIGFAGRVMPAKLQQVERDRGAKGAVWRDERRARQS